MPCLRAASTASRTASSSAAATASFCLPQDFTFAIRSSKFMVQHLVYISFNSAKGGTPLSYVKIITRSVPWVKRARRERFPAVAAYINRKARSVPGPAGRGELKSCTYSAHPSNTSGWYNRRKRPENTPLRGPGAGRGRCKKHAAMMSPDNIHKKTRDCFKLFGSTEAENLNKTT